MTLGTAPGPRGPVLVPVAKAIARMTPDGVLTEFPIADSGVISPSSIAAGSDGNLWFPEAGVYGSLIGRISTVGATTEFGIDSALVGRWIASRTRWQPLGDRR